jgi:hypothetical protein
VEFLGDCDEVPEVAEFHVRIDKPQTQYSHREHTSRRSLVLRGAPD